MDKVKEIILLFLLWLFSLPLYTAPNVFYHSWNLQKNSQSYFRIQHLNDYNFLYGRETNDFAFTSGLSFDFSLNRSSHKKIFNFAFISNLYTDRAAHSYINDAGEMIKPQYFTEISGFIGSMRFWNSDPSVIYGMEMTGGITNRKKPIPGLMLWLQSGEDGRGGYHGMYNSTIYENVSREDIKPFFSISPSITKILSFEGRKNRSAYLGIETGISLGSQLSASNIHMLITGQWTFLSFGKKALELKLLGQSNNILHTNGYRTSQEIGMELKTGLLASGFSTIYPFGKENIQWVDFEDNERLMRLYIKFYIT